jgi:hypothetical protein
VIGSYGSELGKSRLGFTRSHWKHQVTDRHLDRSLSWEINQVGRAFHEPSTSADRVPSVLARNGSGCSFDLWASRTGATFSTHRLCHDHISELNIYLMPIVMVSWAFDDFTLTILPYGSAYIEKYEYAYFRTHQPIVAGRIQILRADCHDLQALRLAAGTFEKFRGRVHSGIGLYSQIWICNCWFLPCSS